MSARKSLSSQFKDLSKVSLDPRQRKDRGARQRDLVEQELEDVPPQKVKRNEKFCVTFGAFFLTSLFWGFVGLVGVVN